MLVTDSLAVLILAVFVFLVPGQALALTGDQIQVLAQVGAIVTLASVVAAWRFRKGDGVLGIVIWSALVGGVVAFALFPPPAVMKLM